MTEFLTAAAWLERESGERVPVTGNCSLGRAVGNDVSLVDDRVSRRHATIHLQGENELWLVDLGSRNGTYLNGRRINHPTLLQDGDRLQVGPFALTFRQPARKRPERPTPVPAEQTQMDLRSDECWLLVCDIAGSSRLAREQSSEELAMLVGGWFAQCKEAIEDSGGVINKYLGDGLLAFWHARTEALPHLVQAVRDLQRLQSEIQPPFRIALHHGRVLIGGIPSAGEESLAGPEVNFVFRLERLASELELQRVTSHAAALRLEGAMAVEPAGRHTLAGFDGEYEVYRF